MNDRPQIAINLGAPPEELFDAIKQIPLEARSELNEALQDIQKMAKKAQMLNAVLAAKESIQAHNEVPDGVTVQ
jgi:hypothetical protein